MSAGTTASGGRVILGIVLHLHVARITAARRSWGTVGFLTGLHRTRITVATARVHCTATLSLFLLISLLGGGLRNTHCDCEQNHSDQYRQDETLMVFHLVFS
ncbi:MAG TPA: hypothetical protein VLA93_21365 [Pyrinomonadaceae bacterium]|nr:hypothetical protein [Pyrinomonadaceae bacterium]